MSAPLLCNGTMKQTKNKDTDRVATLEEDEAERNSPTAEEMLRANLHYLSPSQQKLFWTVAGHQPEDEEPTGQDSQDEEEKADG